MNTHPDEQTLQRMVRAARRRLMAARRAVETDCLTDPVILSQVRATANAIAAARAEAEWGYLRPASLAHFDAVTAIAYARMAAEPDVEGGDRG